jgi:hypothetical protein
MSPPRRSRRRRRGRFERRRFATVWRQEVQSAVRPVFVVVQAVDAEHVLEVPPAEDEDPVETLSAESADAALGLCVRVRRLDRRADHPEALRAEDLVEDVTELRIAVVDEKPKRSLLA